MKAAFLSSIILALCALGTLGAPVEEPASTSLLEPDGGFVSSCSGTSLNSNAVLTSNCGDGSGGTITSSIALNGCIANANGALVARAAGGFTGSCTGSHLSGTTLLSTCTTASGGKVSASIDLSKTVNLNIIFGSLMRASRSSFDQPQRLSHLPLSFSVQSE
ncbi:Cyanovirin-N [Mycena rosella]|uniref:Cyanovirin-N n=1 Tax=Mycena rosella TaxID=1033263 RepID=A0AAD7C4F0_MYCRO|nr:Cyanovirin-N [Mycena rosella]